MKKYGAWKKITDFLIFFSHMIINFESNNDNANRLWFIFAILIGLTDTRHFMWNRRLLGFFFFLFILSKFLLIEKITRHWKKIQHLFFKNKINVIFEFDSWGNKTYVCGKNTLIINEATENKKNQQKQRDFQFL